MRLCCSSQTTNLKYEVDDSYTPRTGAGTVNNRRNFLIKITMQKSLKVKLFYVYMYSDDNGQIRALTEASAKYMYFKHTIYVGRLSHK